MKIRITEEMYAAIPQLIADGKNRHQIAELYGVKVASLQVMCSRRQISLRPIGSTRRATRRKAEAIAIEIADKLPRDHAVTDLIKLRLEAKARGTTEIGLVARMLDIIIHDKLYDAVLGKVGEMEAA